LVDVQHLYAGGACPPQPRPDPAQVHGRGMRAPRVAQLRYRRRSRAYKSFFCREPEPLVDAFLPLTLRGRLAAAGFRAALAAKRTIRETRTLGGGVKEWRGAGAR